MTHSTTKSYTPSCPRGVFYDFAELALPHTADMEFCYRYAASHLGGDHGSMHKDALLTSQEVADLLGLKNQRTLSVWRSTKRYDLKFVKYGRSVRYRRSDVESFIQSRLSTPPAAD